MDRRDSDQGGTSLQRRGTHFGALLGRRQVEPGAARRELSHAEDTSQQIEAAAADATVAGVGTARMDTDQDRSPLQRRGARFGALHRCHQNEHGAARNEYISPRIEAAAGYTTVAWAGPTRYSWRSWNRSS
jgi:hypothetical protein